MSNKIQYSDAFHYEIQCMDTNARAYGFEIGRLAEKGELGESLPAVIEPVSLDNPFLDDNWRDQLNDPESNLVAHARRELEHLGEDQETIVGLIKVVEAFAEMGHSGGSAAACIPIVNDLLQYKNLRPLTKNPDEWNLIAEEVAGEPNLYQSRRNPAAFSRDGGKTYSLVSDENKVTYISDNYQDRLKETTS